MTKSDEPADAVRAAHQEMHIMSTYTTSLKLTIYTSDYGIVAPQILQSLLYTNFVSPDSYKTCNVHVYLQKIGLSIGRYGTKNRLPGTYGLGSLGFLAQ